jgi:hypothetical protein
MKITAVVQGLWVATVFSASLFATQGLVDPNPTPYQWGASGYGDAGAQLHPDGDLSIFWSASESR